MSPRGLSAPDRTRQILEDLEAVRENLLALSDDVWQAIDHNDPEALEAGVDFKRAYNQKMAAFNSLATEISALVQRYTSVDLAEGEAIGSDDGAENERIVAALNRDEPHTVDEDFTYRRPYGFILNGKGTTGVTTWKRLYELFCQQLLRGDPERFRGLPNHPDFISNRGNRDFSTNASELRDAAPIGDGIFAEVHFSANSLRDQMRDLLATFEIPKEELKVFLREDRDAMRERR